MSSGFAKGTRLEPIGNVMSVQSNLQTIYEALRSIVKNSGDDWYVNIDPSASIATASSDQVINTYSVSAGSNNEVTVAYSIGSTSMSQRILLNVDGTLYLLGCSGNSLSQLTLTPIVANPTSLETTDLTNGQSAAGDAAALLSGITFEANNKTGSSPSTVLLYNHMQLPITTDWDEDAIKASPLNPSGHRILRIGKYAVPLICFGDSGQTLLLFDSNNVIDTSTAGSG